MHASWSRRALIEAGGTALAAAMVGPDLQQILGGRLPVPLKSLLGQDGTEAARMVAELLKLEEEARLLKLPASPLSRGQGGMPADPARLYELAMPRLVALVDRAERVRPGLADQAGALLARLHATQYDPPDAWFGQNGEAVGVVPAPGAGLVFPERPPRTAPALLPSGDEPDLARPMLNLPTPQTPSVQALIPPVSTSLHFAELKDEYESWFAAAEIRTEHRESADWHLTMLRQSRERYAGIGKQLGIPWYFIGAVHGLEASFNFRAHLHNGDFPLSQRTRQVPAGRPLTWLPPSDWEASARDALRLMGFAGQEDWSLPRMLYRLEAYNGFGYRRGGRATPYLWSFSTLYERGKFVSDGRFDPKASSQQCGAAVMLKVLDLAGELG